jgi:carboxyl-terminal processing protease
MNHLKRTYLLTLAAVACLGLAFVAGFFTRGLLPGFSPQFPLLGEAYSLLNAHAYDPLPTPSALEHGMIKGMLQAYGDPYTTLFEPVQARLQSDSLTGSFGGIGVRLGKDAQGYPVLYPIPDSPAQKAGVKDGDRLLKVDALAITPQTSTDDLQGAVRGKVDTQVKITIGRPPDYAPLEITITRAEIPLPSVTYHLDATEARLGVVEINIIAASTVDEITHAIQDLQGRGATAFVLDLRDNGGGLLDAGINIARLFLKDGNVIQQQYRGQDVVTYKVEKPGPFADLPMVILVNQNTASAAEIISGALQAQKRALLIGSQTYGKNTIQLVYQLSDNSSLHITSAHWWIPNLEFPIDGHGLKPDIPISPDNTDPEAAIKAAIQALFPNN